MRKKFTLILVVFIISSVFFSVHATNTKVSENITLYTVDSQSFLLFPDSATITYEKDSGNDKAQKTLDALAESVNFALKDDGLFPNVRHGITVKVKDRTALVNFSKEYTARHCGGTLSEKMTIYAIVNTLTTLPEIDEVSFTVNGKKNASLKGHMDLSRSYKFDPTIVCSDVL